MGIRNTHRVGDYLMTSDISGRVFYASEMRKQWDGAWVHRSEWEPRHPQDFVRARYRKGAVETPWQRKYVARFQNPRA